MDSRKSQQRSSIYSGAFNSYAPPRAKSLSQGVSYIQHDQSFLMKPGSTTHGLMQGPATQFQYSQGTLWGQMYAKSESGESTKYRELVKNFNVTDLTRANKVLVKGGSDSLSQSPNTWKGKSYSGSAMTAASLIRLNETTTAFGSQGFSQQGQNVGSGIMAEALHQKWSAKNSGASLSSQGLLGTLESKYPQLQTVEKMRKQGAEALTQQVGTSLMSAAISAGDRAIKKNLSGWQINEYVQRKFVKHGLGELPGGWMEALRQKHGQ